MERSLDSNQLATSTKCPRIAVFGEWDTANLGDRSIFEGVQTYFQKMGWTIDAYGLGSLTPVSIDRIRQPCQDQPNSACARWVKHPLSESWFSNESLQQTWQIIRGIRQQYRMNLLLPQLSKADAILVGGGLLLSDRNLHFPQSLVGIARAAKRLQIPLLCIGCGAVEDWSSRGREMITEFVAACTFIAAREQETSHKLSEILAAPIPVFGDFALSLPTANEKYNYTQPTLAINVMQLVTQQAGEQECYESILVEAVSRWVQQFDKHQDITIKVFTTGVREDTQPAKRVAEQLTAPQVKFYVPESTDQLNQLLQNCTAVIASRLHAAILAISQGTPVIGVGAGHVSQKLYNFFKAIGIDGYNISTLDDDAVEKILKTLNRQNLEKQNLHITLPETDAIRAKINTVLNRRVSLDSFT